MAFFALPVTGAVRASLVMGLADLKRERPRMNWVHPEDYHLTLRFIGGLPVDAVERIIRETRPLPFEPFALELEGLQYFPPHRDRGVLWVGLKTLHPVLIDLQQRLEAEVQALGFEPERRAFTPHLTVARFRNEDFAPLMEALPRFTGHPWGTLECHEYALMKRRSGARDHSGQALYEVLARFSV